eukprot:196658_1
MIMEAMTEFNATSVDFLELYLLHQSQRVNLTTFFIILTATGIIINAAVLVMIIIVTTISILHLLKMKNMNATLQWLFYLSAFGCCIVLISNIFQFIFCFTSNELSESSLIAGLVGMFGYLIYIDCILATLLVRLYTTFNESAYGMSDITRIIFIISMVVIAIVSITILIFNVLWFISIQVYWFLFVWFLIVVKFLLYAVCATSAVYMFSRNLFSLALQQTSQSCKNVSKLKASQQKMIHMSAKYVALFFIAIVFAVLSIIFFTLATFSLMSFHFHSIMLGICCSVNIICMYLQFSFASYFYGKYCRCVDECFKKRMTRNMMNSISEIRRNGYDGCPTTET